MIRKSMTAFVLFAATLVLFPLVAGAHVEIECANNGKLTSVELVFPESPALDTATPGAVTGWTPEVTKRAGSASVEKVTWTNTGQVDGDGTFPLELGTLPASTKAVNFKALDACDDGEVTRWVEPGENS